MNFYIEIRGGGEVVSPPHEASKTTIFKNLKIILSIIYTSFQFFGDKYRISNQLFNMLVLYSYITVNGLKKKTF